MLVHKTTMGCIQYAWNSEGTAIVRCSFKNFPFLKEDEWWEINDESVLGRTILMHYPFLIPVTDDGELIDVIIDKPLKQKKSNDYVRREMIDSARERGYVRKYRDTCPTNLLVEVADDLIARSRE